MDTAYQVFCISPSSLLGTGTFCSDFVKRHPVAFCIKVLHATNGAVFIGVPNERASQMTHRLTIAERYATILEVNRAAITQPGINAIFRGMCESVKKVLTYDRMGLSLYTPETGGLKLAAAEGCGPDSLYRVGLMLDGKETHHGWVFQNQKAIVRRDLQKEMEFKIEQRNCLEGIRSYCAVPLVTRGHSLGVLIILSSQKNRYSQEHAEFLQEVSDQLAFAVKSLIPSCSKHFGTNLICPRCIASGGGRATAATAAKHKEQLSDWGKQGGRGRKKNTSWLNYCRFAIELWND
jgi:hypothetical protein